VQWADAAAPGACKQYQVGVDNEMTGSFRPAITGTNGKIQNQKVVMSSNDNNWGTLATMSEGRGDPL
jgi:hypothetical protein